MTILSDSMEFADRAAPLASEQCQTPTTLWKESLRFVDMVYFDNDLLEMDFVWDTVLNSSMIKDVLELLSSRLPSTAGHLLVNISGLNNVEYDTTRIFSKFAGSLRLALIGTGPADLVLARFFMRNLPADLPCLYAQTREEAMAFLFPA